MTIFSDWHAAMAGSLGIGSDAMSFLLLLVAATIAYIMLGVLIKYLKRTAKANTYNWDDVLVSAVGAPLRVTLWVVVGFVALEIYPVAEGAQTQLLKMYDTALVALIAWFIHRLIAGGEAEMLAERRGLRASTDKATVRAVAKLLRVTLWMITGLMILQSIGVSVSGLLAFGGIGGIAVGFAAKDLLANFFGGLSIYLDRPFTSGDWIRSPDRDIEGTVEDIGWRLTRIRTFDQRPLYVPNAVFSQIAVENPSRMHNRRIKETIGLRYDDAKKVAPVVAQVREMLEQHPDIDTGRTLIVNFVSFGPSSLDFLIYTFTKTTNWVDFHAIKQDVLLQILEIIHALDADVAFPTQTLHVEQIEPEPPQ